MKILSRILFIVLMVLVPLSSYAHKPSDSYLFVQNSGSNTSLRWDIAIRDLENVLSLDKNMDRKITWGELKQSQENIASYALSHLDIKQSEINCLKKFTNLKVERHSDGSYAVLNLSIDCPNNVDNITLDYSLFNSVDPTHRGILIDKRKNHQQGPFVLDPENSHHELVTSSSGAPFNIFINYIVQGIWHIWIGLDHILFIMMLILPFLVLRRNDLAPRQLLVIITAFTVAHSFTLTLAITGLLQLPSRWVETLIAFSIAYVAWNNLSEKPKTTRWRAAFGFGLMHGFGFASVLLDLGLSAKSLLISLLGFNLGVEIGQLVILLCVYPLPWFLGKYPLFTQKLLHHSSLLALSIAMVWMAERGLMLDISRVENLTLVLVLYSLFFMMKKPQKASVHRKHLSFMKREKVDPLVSRF